MKRVLVLGAGGQIGSELTMRLREVYGNSNVVATDLQPDRLTQAIKESGVCLPCDATDGKQIADIVDKYKIDGIFNLVAILSANHAKTPTMGWDGRV